MDLSKGRGGQATDVVTEAITKVVIEMTTSLVNTATTRFEDEMEAVKDRLAILEQAKKEADRLKGAIANVKTALDTVKASLQSKVDNGLYKMDLEALQKRIITKASEAQVARIPAPGVGQAPGNRLSN